MSITTNKTLEQLYTEHEGKVSDKWSAYIAEYNRILGEYRNQPVRMLEIGVQNGGSLEIWSKYFPHAQVILGCDINPACTCLSYEDPRISVIVEDANSDAAQASILAHAPTLDIVIDDGAHRSSGIVQSFARYFPHLADGGIFIAEDLHCSYWQEFEGGLFNPFSSITFFKRLADIVNHEHWGLNKSAADLLTGISSSYNVRLDAESLLHIHSVEFINSMCIIRKSSPEHNRLGKRIFAGSIEAVTPGVLNLGQETTPDQTNNPWAARSMPPDEELVLRLKELADAHEHILTLNATLWDRDQAIAAYENSTSWRLTRPLRSIKHYGQRMKRVIMSLAGKAGAK